MISINPIIPTRNHLQLERRAIKLFGQEKQPAHPQQTLLDNLDITPATFDAMLEFEKKDTDKLLADHHRICRLREAAYMAGIAMFTALFLLLIYY